MNTNRKFNFNWFDGQIGLFNHFLNDLKGKPNLKFLEVGSFEGKSTCWMLDNILTSVDSTIDCIDTWEGGFEHSEISMPDIYKNFLSNIETNPGQVVIKKGVSFNVLLQMLATGEYNERYDFIYIDGGHTVKDVLPDLILSFKMLKPGGIMAMDDYTWGSTEFTLDKRPQLAIDAFLVGWSSELQVIHKNYQVWIKKL